MDNTMEFKNWLRLAENTERQVDEIEKEIGKRFGLPGLDPVRLRSYPVSDLKRDNVVKGDLDVGLSLFSTVSTMGMIRDQMSDEQKEKLEDILKSGRVKTVGDLASSIATVINGTQEQPNQ